MIKSGLCFLLFVSAWLCSSCHQNKTDHPDLEFPAEQKEIKDRNTGIAIRQLTNYKWHSHHFYFTNPGWFAVGETIGFHGSRTDGSAFLGHIRFDNTEHLEVAFSTNTGHIHSNDENLIEGDGEGLIKLWKWNGSTYDGPSILCEHNSSMQTQHSHPHPRFNEAGNQVLYTSDISGYCNVYLVDIPEFDSLPSVYEKDN